MDVVSLVLDPGHGGAEEGCKYDRFTEKDHNLVVCLLLEQEIKRANWPIAVTMTRTEDKTVKFKERKALIDASEPDLTLSFHADSNGDDRVCGLQCYRLHRDHAAHTICSVICAAYPRPGFWVSRGVVKPRRHPVVIAKPTYRDGRKHWTSRPFGVLDRYGKKPMALIETGFATNPKEREWMLSTSGKDALVDAVMDGLDYWLTYLRVIPACV